VSLQPPSSDPPLLGASHRTPRNRVNSLLPRHENAFRPATTSVGASSHMVSSRGLSVQEVEDPCADLETPPPSHFFTATIYERKNIFAISQRLTSASPSITVFSARTQNPRQLLPSPIPEDFYPPLFLCIRLGKGSLLGGIARLASCIRAETDLILQQAQDYLTAFLTNCVSKNLQCCIRRNRNALKRFFPSYFLHTSGGNRFLLAAKKRPGYKTANYLITMNETELSAKSPGYLGKLRSDFLGTEFNIYGKGVHPSNKKAASAARRENLGTVMFIVSELGEKKPRKMRVAIPALDEIGRRVVWKPALSHYCSAK